MQAPPPRSHEAEALRALNALHVLDTQPEAPFDALVRVAAQLCGTPIALVSLVDEQRQWFKARFGLDAPQTDRTVSFCGHTVLSDAVFVVPDALADERFADNPLVTGAPHVRFYAGAPLKLATGECIGSLCVIDHQPRELDEAQRAALEDLASVVVNLLKSRSAAQALAADSTPFRALSDASPLGLTVLDGQGQALYTNQPLREIFQPVEAAPAQTEAPHDRQTGRAADPEGRRPATDAMPALQWLERVHPEDADRVRLEWQGCTARGLPVDLEFRVRRVGGEVRWVRALSRPVERADGGGLWHVGSIEDVTERLQARHRHVALLDAVRQQFIVSVTDLQGRIIEVNDAFCAISGYARHELLGQTHRMVRSLEHDLAFFEDMWSTLSEGRSWRGEICNRARDGRLYWVDSTIVPLMQEDGEVDRYVSVRIDITARRQQEQELRASRRMLVETGEVAGVAGWSLAPGQQRMRWSGQLCRMHGLPPNRELNLQDMVALYRGPAAQALARAVDAARVGGGGWDLELEVASDDGIARWVHSVCRVEREGSNPPSLRGAVQDVTTSVLQRQALEAAHERISLATESGRIGVWDLAVDADTLRWDSWMALLYQRGSARSPRCVAEWLALVHEGDRDRFRQALDKACAGAGNLDTEFRIRLPDGGVRHLRITAHMRFGRDWRVRTLVGVQWDVSELRELSAELARQHELLRVTLRSIGDAVITTNPQGEVTWMNPVAERMTGWRAEEAVGRPAGEVFHIVNEQTRQMAQSPVDTCLSLGETVGLPQQTLLLARDGREHGIEDSAAPILTDGGELLGVVLVFHDVSEQRRLAREMTYRATHDLLTGLVNRGEFETRLRRLLKRAQELGGMHALLYIDLDNFKLVNDACGHPVGDLLLQQVGRLLAESVRGRDTLARLGGDEFGIILENCGVDQAMRVAQKICQRMDDFRFTHEDRRFRIGTSIGLVPVDGRWGTLASVQQAADASCYAAKEAGRNRVHAWFDTDETLRNRQFDMRWTARIERALDENLFELHAQRIEPLAQGSAAVHAEVLLRLRNDDGTLVLPGAFLPAAERFHLATRIDRWVLVRVLDWLNNGPALPQLELLSVNLSGQSVGDCAFHDWAIGLIGSASPSVRSRLCLEITETVAVTNLADAARFIEQVRTLGVKVALDDFGAGASSFGYLKSLPVDYLKIDGHFIRDLANDPLAEVAVRCFADVAQVLGVRTVAEFVDSEAVRERLLRIGIGHAQGHLLHRAAPLDELRQAAAAPEGAEVSASPDLPVPGGAPDAPPSGVHPAPRPTRST